MVEPPRAYTLWYRFLPSRAGFFSGFLMLSLLRLWFRGWGLGAKIDAGILVALLIIEIMVAVWWRVCPRFRNQ